MKAIDKDPAQRYRSWLDFGKDITRAFMSLRPGPEVSASDSEKFGKLRDMPFFKDFGEVELWEVVRVGTWQTIEPGTVLMREGEQGDTFYLLLDGEVDVTLLGKPLASSSPAPASARCSTSPTASSAAPAPSLRATRSSSCRSSSPRCASPATRCQNCFHKAFMRVLVERLAKANRQLAQALRLVRS